jgi:hypothetical protein
MNRNRLNPIDLFVAVLAILLISVSFYQTWLGLQQIFGPASFIISLVLSAMLLMLCWLLRDAKLKGNSTTGLMTIYVFIASFCFMANFNALYTRFMRTDIYTTELRDINDKFNFLETDIKKKLNYEVSDEKTRQKIVSKTKQLMEQITNKGQLGFGDKARQLVSEIESPKLLGQKLTILTVYKSDYDDLAMRMGNQIIDMMDQLSPSEKTLKTDAENAKLHWNKQIEKLLLMSNEDINSIAQGEIDKSLQQYNDLVNRSKSILGDEKIKIELAKTKTPQVGKIGYAFEHAISNFSVYQFVVLMGCVLLDFLIPILLLLITKPDDKNKGNSVFKREGKVLIPNN